MTFNPQTDIDIEQAIAEAEASASHYCGHDLGEEYCNATAYGRVDMPATGMTYVCDDHAGIYLS